MFTKNLVYSFAVIAVLLLPACGQKDETEKEPAPLKVINVLDVGQYDDAHIKGSINMSYDQLEAGAATWNKETPVVVYCSNYMCTGSAQGAKMLASKGFKHAYAYEGGMAEWYQLHKNDPSYALEGPAKLSYLELVMEKPAEHDADVKIISAEELKKMMKEANLL